jgi:2-hydroxycyclohexanecarboxyl-CoA dehydrogenase
MDLGLKDKSVLITGAGRGIGRAIALGFAKEGACVAVNDIKPELAEAVVEEVTRLGAKAMACVADITSYENVTRMVQDIVTRFGGIHVLVNNAGVGDQGKLFLDQTQEDWDRVLRLGLMGTIYCNRAVLEHMVKQKEGKIIAIGSDAGRVGEPHMAAYSASKGGIISHCKALARELGPSGININVVSPGATETETTLERRKEREKAMGKEKADALLQKILKAYPLRRYAQPEEIAAAVLFLASQRANFITGQVLSVSGGYCTA